LYITEEEMKMIINNKGNVEALCIGLPGWSY